jgi:hypothetical protein
MKRLNARGTAKYVFTALLVWWILRTVPLAHIVEAIRNSHTQDVLAGILALVVARPIMALRMKRITDQQGLSLTVPQLIEISLVSTFYGTFLPGSLSGGLIRWHRIASQDQKPTAALTAIAFDRLMDTITAVTFGLVCWIASAPERNFVGLGLVTAFRRVRALHGGPCARHALLRLSRSIARHGDSVHGAGLDQDLRHADRHGTVHHRRVRDAGRRAAHPVPSVRVSGAGDRRPVVHETCE